MWSSCALVRSELGNLRPETVLKSLGRFGVGRLPSGLQCCIPERTGGCVWSCSAAGLSPKSRQCARVRACAHTRTYTLHPAEKCSASSLRLCFLRMPNSPSFIWMDVSVDTLFLLLLKALS